MTRIVIGYDTFADLSIEQHVFAGLDAEIVVAGQWGSPESWQAAKDADALMVTIQPVPATLIDTLSHCKIICRIGTGLDAIDIAAATRKGIWVTNVPDYAIDEVSSHAIALLLTHARQLPRMFDLVNRRVWWDPKQVSPMRRLRGQTLGLLGYGRIGQAVGIKARGRGLNLIGCDPYISPTVFESDGVRAVDLDTLLHESDYLSLHSPLTETTRHILDSQALAKMKPTAFIINTARGPLIDEIALLDAVRSGRLAGAALDVLTIEPPAADNPLLQESRILITPHVAWYSAEAQDDVRRKGAEEVLRVLGGQRPKAAVNQIEVEAKIESSKSSESTEGAKGSARL